MDRGRVLSICDLPLLWMLEFFLGTFVSSIGALIFRLALLFCLLSLSLCLGHLDLSWALGWQPGHCLWLLVAFQGGQGGGSSRHYGYLEDTNITWGQVGQTKSRRNTVWSLWSLIYALQFFVLGASIFLFALSLCLGHFANDMGIVCGRLWRSREVKRGSQGTKGA